jgi:hypothetical protein
VPCRRYQGEAGPSPPCGLTGRKRGAILEPHHVPVSLVAVAVLLILFVPGYLFQAGVREYRSVLSAERDLYAVAQAVAISAGGLIALFFVLRVLGCIGISCADWLQDELLHDPAQGKKWSLTTSQEVFLIGLLIFPTIAGRMFGKALKSHDERKSRKGKDKNGLFFPDSPTRKSIKDLAASAHHGPIFVRVVRQGEEDVIGLLDRAAAEATTSPLGQGLALSARWAPDEQSEEGLWRQLPGAHIGISGIVQIQQWKEGAGPMPVWLSKVLVPAPDQG